MFASHWHLISCREEHDMDRKNSYVYRYRYLVDLNSVGYSSTFCVPSENQQMTPVTALAS